jgi:hypothetical protein
VLADSIVHWQQGSVSRDDVETLESLRVRDPLLSVDGSRIDEPLVRIQ